MKFWGAVLISTAVLFSPSGLAATQPTTKKLFLLENGQVNHWCAYSNESTWNGAVQNAGAMTVGTLSYLNGRLMQIDVTETDETGDWMVYDNYYLDDQGLIVKLSRMINVLPGNRSILQTFAINDGQAKKTATTEKKLSTGKRLRSPNQDWLPDLPIRVGTRSFPFHHLLEVPGLTAKTKVCVP